MKKIFYNDFHYMPETYNYPEEKNIINKKFKNYKLNLSDLWLIKPNNGSGGKGIFVLTYLKNINYKQFVITKYITNVNLINGKKYDLRLFALISGLKPLRIYFYREGYVRIATEKYSLDMQSLENKFVHLTNSDLNRHNKNFISSNGYNNINANAWNIFMYKNFLKKYNIDWNNIRQKIKDIIIKSIISLYKNLSDYLDKNYLNEQSFYEILGYDILITDKFIPILLEINKNPDMRIFADLDKPIKTDLFIDTLNLIGIIPFSRKTDELLNFPHKFKNRINDKINNAFCELNRPRGDYELIFPTKETINNYKKFFINNSEENKIFWDKIMSLK